MRARQGTQPQPQQRQQQSQQHEARSRQARFFCRRSGGLTRTWGALLLALALGTVTPVALADNTPPVAADSVNQIAEPALTSTHRVPTSAQDLSLFGVLALGIIGLLWVRRHTSEL